MALLLSHPLDTSSIVLARLSINCVLIGKAFPKYYSELWSCEQPLQQPVWHFHIGGLFFFFIAFFHTSLECFLSTFVLRRHRFEFWMQMCKMRPERWLRGKGVCSQVWGPELNPLSLKGRRRQLMPMSPSSLWLPQVPSVCLSPIHKKVT